MSMGVCLDALNPSGRPSARRLHNLGVDGARLVAFEDRKFYVYQRELVRSGLKTAHVYTAGSFTTSDYGDDIERINTPIAEALPDISVVGNEWNVIGDASWPPGGDDAFIDLWSRAAPYLPGRRYVGGLYSESDVIGHLSAIWGRLDPKPHGIDFHPYLDDPDTIEQTLRRAYQEFHCEIAVLEWNWDEPTEIPGFVELLREITDHAMYFCWSDGQVRPMGLIRVHGGRKPVYYAYQKALSPRPATP